MGVIEERAVPDGSDEGRVVRGMAEGQTQGSQVCVQGTAARLDPGVPGRNGDSLFYMIPLEHWNMEQRDIFGVKRMLT